VRTAIKSLRHLEYRLMKSVPATSDLALTDRQKAVLGRIVSYTAAHGYPPTIEELSRSLRFRSPGGAMSHVTALVKKGYLSRVRGVARGFKVLRNPDGVL
jgi:repressor LexA